MSDIAMISIIPLRDYKIGGAYHYTSLIENKETIDNPFINLKEYGNYLIGEHFIVIKDFKRTVSFMLESYSTQYGGVYKCIYNQ